MALFKCKMCGGSLEIAAETTIIECDYCGTTQTLPRLDDDRRANLYDRANHFRRNNEFDKAMGIYEQILNEDNTDAEAYWSLVLCRYGIEYVEDPASHKRIPTVNRAQFTSVFDDDNYKSALQYADSLQRSVYESEAKAINEIQKGILAISQKEEPFDVFICYKESDNSGRRTPDSVLAQDLYYQLTQEGFKVFFSRITLEDKLGSAYEPYIFAALNSAKVMVVLGTKTEYFNAVWVKNEWSRYLALVKQGQKKILIPAYKDMDPYDLPEEFSHLQAQDMSKLGFMQDLIRGIKKITKTDEPKTIIREAVVTESSAHVIPLLKRAFLFLEDGDWNNADEYCEKVLDINPENAQAYIGKLMIELKVKKQSALAECEKVFDSFSNYQKAIRFADDELAEELKGYISQINERNKNKMLQEAYNTAAAAIQVASSEEEWRKVASLLEKISGFKDADTLKEKCLREADTARKEEIYAKAMESYEGAPSGSFYLSKRLEAFEDALALFQTIPDFKDAEEKSYECLHLIEELKQEIEQQQIEKERRQEQEKILAGKRKKRNRKIAAVVVAVIVLYWAADSYIIPEIKYSKANSLFDEENYAEAYTLFSELDDYKASQFKKQNVLKMVEAWGKAGKYKEAYSLLAEINYWKFPERTAYKLAAEGNYRDALEEGLNTLVLPEFETTVQDFAFQECKNLVQMNLSDSVASIGISAFAGCTNLKSISLSNTLESIGDGAFSGCTILGEIVIPDSVISIGDYVFDECTNLQYNQYDFGNYLGSEKNPYMVFVGVTDTDVGRVRIHPNTKFIMSDAFGDCSLLTEITIPEGVLSIGSYAFANCSSLGKIELPSTLKRLGQCAFYGCLWLNEITLTEGITEVEYGTFLDCRALKKVSLPDSLISISDLAFERCMGLESLKLPESLKYIGKSAFTYSGLTQIIIPESVQNIDAGAFVWCGYDFTIYARTSKEPEGWQEGWNGGYPVEWSYKG